MSEISLWNGDCLELMGGVEDNSIDLVLTDPPYGINLTPQRNTSLFKNTKVINDDNLDFLPKLVSELYRISKNIVLVFCAWQKIDIFKMEFEKKFIIKNILVWNKLWFGMGNNYRPQYELCLLCCKNDNIKTKNHNKSNILNYMRVNPNKMVHSCEKPIELLEDLIIELSNSNDTILDCFMGSGSTGVACKNLNRNFIGIELDKNYFDIATKRINGEIVEKKTVSSNDEKEQDIFDLV